MNKFLNEIKQLASLIYTVAIVFYERIKKWIIALIATIFAVGCMNPQYQTFQTASGGYATQVECEDSKCDQLAADNCPDGKFATLARTNHSITFACYEETNSYRRNYIR